SCFRLRCLRAAGCSPRLRLGKRSLELRNWSKRRELCVDSYSVLTGLILRGTCPRDGFGERTELLGVGLRRVFGGGDGVARAVELGVSIFRGVTERFGLLRGGLQLAHCVGEIVFYRFGSLLRSRPLGLERFEPAPLDQARCGGARSASFDAVAVPAPEIALLGYEPLA